MSALVKSLSGKILSRSRRINQLNHPDSAMVVGWQLTTNWHLPMVCSFHELNVQGNGHFLTDKNATSFEDCVPVSKVFLVDLGCGGESDARVAPTSRSSSKYSLKRFGCLVRDNGCESQRKQNPRLESADERSGRPAIATRPAEYERGSRSQPILGHDSSI